MLDTGEINGSATPENGEPAGDGRGRDPASRSRWFQRGNTLSPGTGNRKQAGGPPRVLLDFRRVATSPPSRDRTESHKNLRRFLLSSPEAFMAKWADLEAAHLLGATASEREVAEVRRQAAEAGAFMEWARTSFPAVWRKWVESAARPAK